MGLRRSSYLRPQVVIMMRFGMNSIIFLTIFRTHTSYGWFTGCLRQLFDGVYQHDRPCWFGCLRWFAVFVTNLICHVYVGILNDCIQPLINLWTVCFCRVQHTFNWNARLVHTREHLFMRMGVWYDVCTMYGLVCVGIVSPSISNRCFIILYTFMHRFVRRCVFECI